MEWFQEVEETLKDVDVDLSIFNDPQRIFNFDESGFQLVPARFKALCAAGTRNVYSVNNNCDPDDFTVLFGSNVDSEITPPMILYAGKQVTREIAEMICRSFRRGMANL